MEILKTIDLCKQYGEGENEPHALDHVSIAVEEGKHFFNISQIIKGSVATPDILWYAEYKMVQMR